MRQNRKLKLQSIDISHNRLSDDAGVKLAKAFKNVKTMEHINLRDNALGVESSDAFTYLVKENRNITKCVLDLNVMKYTSV